MKFFWRRVHERLRSGENVFVALVVKHTIHSPGTTGARLAVFESEEIIGTIGGGVMERNLVGVATEALRTGRYEPTLRALVHREDGEGEKSGMMCAGEQTNLYYLFDPRTHQRVFQAVSESEEKGHAGVLRFSSSNIEFEPGFMDSQIGQYRLNTSSDAWTYSEQLLNLRRVGILGGGHCGLALSRTLGQLGYHVSIVDDRVELTTMQRNTFADKKVTVSDMEEAASRLDYPEITQVFVMTTDVKSDLLALKGALARPFPFIGIMGSKAKIGNIKKALRGEGILDDQLARLTGPVGLPIQSQTPDEIAISVAAQLLERRGRSA
ncbi:MAG: XdhC family protein [Bacteroidetes bacterium]|nr:XdhC family protein [Bacteroidota bacterium]